MPTRAAYFDCASGVSGDMCLGALLDAGVRLPALKAELGRLGIAGFELSRRRVTRSSLSATRATVKADAGSAPARRFKDIRKLINGSSLSPRVRKQSLAVFTEIFTAEAEAHATARDKTHLHELAALDAMVDIVGTVAGLELLGVDEVYCSAINTGSGTVNTAHGRLPVPAPATALLLRGMRVYSDGPDMELTTPTGAALMRTLAGISVPMPDMTLQSVGIGAGGTDTPGWPNALRLFTGTTYSSAERGGRGYDVTVIEANIDDMDPRFYGHVMDKLLDAGALDVALHQVIMKKNRPGVVLSVICEERTRPALAGIILSETTTLGLRHYTAGRTVLGRETRTVKTEFGPIRIKQGFMGGVPVKSMPEYDDIRAAALKHGVPVRDVAEAAKAAAGRRRT